jgi:hypothetical protein
MDKIEVWKNFSLGEELSLSGVFLYNGLRRFHEIATLSKHDEIFEVLYNLAVGVERLLKIAIGLVEYEETIDASEFERSLITHNHHELLNRLKKHTAIRLGATHNRFLNLLVKFYRSFRYGRYLISSSRKGESEIHGLHSYLKESLGVEFDNESMFAVPNEPQFRKHIHNTVMKISMELFKIISERARELNIYTDELPYGSKAQIIFQGQTYEDFFFQEEVVWKELLLFFMNTDADSKTIDFLRSIEPLNFDAALINEYLASFRSPVLRAEVVEAIDAEFGERMDIGERLQALNLIGNPNVDFEETDAW